MYKVFHPAVTIGYNDNARTQEGASAFSGSGQLLVTATALPGEGAKEESKKQNQPIHTNQWDDTRLDLAVVKKPKEEKK